MSQDQAPSPQTPSKGSEKKSTSDVSRRAFLKTAGTAAVVATSTVPSLTSFAEDKAAKKAAESPETVIKHLYETFSDAQKKAICYDWNYQDAKRGLLRTRISNNWQITPHEVNGNFYTGQQRSMIREIFEGIIQPEWHKKIDQQLKDDAGGFGEKQAIAIFGNPSEGKFELVLTGRHMTLRCDGNSEDHVAFGGPIFYGHAAGENFYEDADHPGNVFWEQAKMANGLYQMLDSKHRKIALVDGDLPAEEKVGFQGKEGKFPGIPVTDFASDQKEHLQKVLAKLIEPYRQTDRDEVISCLKAQGGLDKCSLAFYKADDIGEDGVWDNWRLEGPSFVWYFRGAPHVHVWVNVADDASVKLNA